MKSMSMMMRALLLAAMLYSCDGTIAGPDSGDGTDTTEPDYDAVCTLSPLFSDGAVLQRNREVAVTGRTEPGAAVRVSGSWNDENVVVEADRDGKFKALLRTPDAGGPYTLEVNGTVVEDVMIGEVWLCAGQSNMRFRLDQSDMDGLSGDESLPVHAFVVHAASSESPQEELEGGKWYYGKVDEIKGRVSAVADYFARPLQQELNIPVGVIVSAVSSSCAEEWMSEESFAGLDGSYREMYEPSKEGCFASCWYNSMLHPLFGFRIAGVAWYQGEANVYWPDSYQDVMAALVNDWRSGFGDSSLPFYMVQLPSYRNTRWIDFRLVQQAVADNLEHSGLVPTIDTGEESNIHPVHKRPVGERLASLALSNVHGLAGFRKECPAAESAVAEDGCLRVSFSGVDKLVSASGGSPGYFEICGEDGVYHDAEAEISGNTVLLRSTDVQSPVGARYYHVAFGEPDLFTSDGWPVPPFTI